MIWLWIYVGGFTVDLMTRAIRIGIDDALDGVDITRTAMSAFLWPATIIVLIGYLTGAAWRIYGSPR